MSEIGGSEEESRELLSDVAGFLEGLLPDLDMVRHPDIGNRYATDVQALLLKMRPFRSAHERARASAAPHSNTPMDVSDGGLRQRWREAGGSFHGPNVEHGDMPEAKLLPFLRSLVTREHELIQLVAEALHRAHPSNTPTTEDEFEHGTTIDAYQSIREGVADALELAVRDFDRSAFLSKCVAGIHLETDEDLDGVAAEEDHLDLG